MIHSSMLSPIQFLRDHRERILSDWARMDPAVSSTRRRARDGMIDELSRFLEALAGASPGGASEPLTAPPGSSLEEAAADYRQLRKCLFRLLKSAPGKLTPDEEELLHEALDVAITGACAASLRATQETLQRSETAARLHADRTSRLQAVTAALSGATTPAQVVDVVVPAGVEALDAQSGVLCLLSEDAQWFELSRAVGYPEELITPWKRFPAEAPMMFRESVRTGRPVLYETLESFVRDYPHLAAAPSVTGNQAFACIPLMLEGRCLGTLGLSFKQAQSFSESDRRFMMTLADQCAQALERARLYEAERSEVGERRRAELFREQFIGILGHDLRGPLTAVKMSTELLLKRGEWSEAQHRALQRIDSSTDRMTRMIADILDFARGRLGGGIPVERVPADLHQLMRHTLEELNAAHPGRRLESHTKGSGQGEFDTDRIAQVVSNLVSNALTHGRPDLPVRVTSRGEGPSVVLEVWNQGSPIPPELLPTIFEPFRRGMEKRSSTGLGLGLYIVSEVVKAHGGQVEVRSTAEEGTLFTVRLPRTDSSAS
jgi:signal transduction histidine kinase